MSTEELYEIRYFFGLSTGVEFSMELQLNPSTMELVDETPEDLPAWTALGFHQCPNCPLAPEAYERCPLASSLVNLVDICKDLNSYDDIDLRVVTPGRTVTARTTAQRGVSSLLGLMVATSPCPRTKYFRPMARFHLPLATEEETIYRAASMYMLAQYFVSQREGSADYDLKGLSDIYANMQQINTAMAERLRAAESRDGTVNAIILLDLFAKAMPSVIDDSLDELKYLFTPYLDIPGGSPA